MILELTVKDLALIRGATVSFGDGLNILTGETGAGKSVVIGSIALLLGKKAQPELIREGAEYAYIELIAKTCDRRILQELSAMDLEPDENGTFILSRKIGHTRSGSKINGESVSLAVLRQATACLIDLYGQHEHETLLDSAKHLGILDEYGSKSYAALLQSTEEAYRRYRALFNEQKRLETDEATRNREADLLRFEVAEIEEAAIVPGEEEQLSAEYRRLQHAKTISDGLSRAESLLGAEGLSEALSDVSALCDYDEALSGIRDQLYDADSILSGVRHDIRHYLDRIDPDEETLHRTEERLNRIRALESKYGRTEEEVLKAFSEKQERLGLLSHFEEHMAELSRQLAASETELSGLCTKLTAARRSAAGELCAALRTELLDLGFTEVKLSVAFREKEPSANGADELQFMTALNPGESERPLSEVASGGELSRFMLALKTVLAETDRIPTLVFDEIDAGISGRTAQKVAEKLALIARRHQVLCITHLPQIASMADVHFRIEKSEQDGRNVTRVERLSDAESEDELARLLGGAEITDAVRTNAREMRLLAQKRKQR